MNYREASINNMKGLGYASIWKDYRGIKCCDGVLTVNSAPKVLALMNFESLNFSGVVFEEGIETHLTFPIVIRKIHDRRVAFSATGNPCITT
jgi:hypothetical protein